MGSVTLKHMAVESQQEEQGTPPFPWPWHLTTTIELCGKINPRIYNDMFYVPGCEPMSLNSSSIVCGLKREAVTPGEGDATGVFGVGFAR